MPRLRVHLREVLKHTARRLWPAQGAIDKAWARAEKLAKELDKSKAPMFRVVECIKHGSTCRGTAIAGFQDLDMLVALDATSLRTGAGRTRTPSDTISRMARTLEERRQGPITLGLVHIRKQDHSVGVTYSGTNGFRVDLVPALKTRSGRLRIPERGSGEWIPTDPAATTRRLDEARVLDAETIDAIRLLKGWKRARGRNAPIPSFAIETLVVDMVLCGARGLDTIVRAFFEQLGSEDARCRIGLGRATPGRTPVTLIDPVSGANLTEEMDSGHRRTLIHTSRRALGALGDIQAHCLEGPSSKAHTAARRLFIGQ